MRILFAGTPETALPSLRALLASAHEVVAVLTRPDAPSGRGRTLRPSPVKSLAIEHGLPVLTPASLRTDDAQDALRALGADLAVVVAYGSLVPAAALEIPREGWINLHFSLLPALRGAAPAQRAVLQGLERTGMSVFRLETGLDTGPVLARQETEIGEFETASALLERMAEAGAELLVEAVDAIAAGTARDEVQDHSLATRAEKLSTAEARIDFALPAREVSAHVRGMSAEPGAWTLWRGARMKVLEIEAPRTADASPALAPGQLHLARTQLLVGTADAPLAIARLAPAGKKPMRAADWARGANLAPGDAFGEELTAPTAQENAR